MPFDSLYGQGFVRVAVGVPQVRVADPQANVESTLALARQASERGRYSRRSPSSACPLTALTICSTSRPYSTPSRALWLVFSKPAPTSPVALVVGTPLVTEGRLFNCAVVVHHGKVAGVVPKSYLPAYRGIL